jgi:hypothetical protein
LPGHDQATGPASSGVWRSAGTGSSAVLTARLGALDGAVLDGQPIFGLRMGLHCGF